MRCAVFAIVTRGTSIAEAAREAGLSDNGLRQGLKRPAVQQLMDQVKKDFLAEIEEKKAVYSARAYEVAAQLMETAESEAVRMKAVEFLTRDLAQNGPSITINNTVNSAPSGYEYVRPGSNIVRIDPPSAVEDAEVVEGKGKS